MFFSPDIAYYVKFAERLKVTNGTYIVVSVDRDGAYAVIFAPLTDWNFSVFGVKNQFFDLSTNPNTLEVELDLE